MKDWISEHLVAVLTSLGIFIISNIVGLVYWLFLTFQTNKAAELITLELQLQMAVNTVQIYETKRESESLDGWELEVLEDAKWRVGVFTTLRQEAMGIRGLPAPGRPE